MLFRSQKPAQREVDAPALEGIQAVKPVRSSGLARSSNPPKDAAAKSKVPRLEKLKLLNGDDISGKFLGIKDGNILWQHPSFSGLIQVKSADISEIRLFPMAAKSRRHKDRKSVV